MSAPETAAPAAEPALRLTIHPAPTTDEEGAIVASITLLLAAAATNTAPPAAAPRESGWSLAGREAGHAASPAATPRWSAPRAWLTRR